MSQKTRREMLKLGAVATGTGLFSSVGAARKRRSHSPKQERKYRVLELNTIVDKKGKAVVAVTIDNDGTKDRYVGQADTDQGNVQVTQISGPQYQSLTSNTGVRSQDTVEKQVSAMGDNQDVIKRFDIYKNTNGECGAYDYTHRRDRIAFELHDELDELSASAVIGALSTAIGSSSLGGPATAALTAAVTLVIGGAALLTDYTEYTIGAIEFDKSALGHTQTMSGAKGGTGYGVTMPNLIPVGYSLGHPGRL
ncbi:hypothetical protein [Halorhabdus salina]|uniref:hypothetical protein n=1 Tax=Halorhabdus salina TaxID=2750670 RepID=UPI0015EF0622|nr:hypothetical protein [Halorhabdus salina]